MATLAKPTSSLKFYDIKMKAPIEETCCSVNPWKSRFALNFKQVPYTTEWVAMPDIANVRKGLNMSASRNFADGSDYYTLPILEDQSNNTLVGDSFDIAVYLQKTFSSSGAGDLFPSQTLDFKYDPSSELLVPLSRIQSSSFLEYREFNKNIDALFTAHVQLAIQGLPLDPDIADASKALFVQRASALGIKRWEDFFVTGEARKNTIQSFHAALGPLSEWFRRTDGPFLLGHTANYADIIVGSWLQMWSRTVPHDEWQEIKTWHQGVFGRLWDALQAYTQVV